MSADFERKPRSGDRSYEVSLAKVSAIGRAPALAAGFGRLLTPAASV